MLLTHSQQLFTGTNSVISPVSSSSRLRRRNSSLVLIICTPYRIANSAFHLIYCIVRKTCLILGSNRNNDVLTLNLYNWFSTRNAAQCWLDYCNDRLSHTGSLESEWSYVRPRTQQSYNETFLFLKSSAMVHVNAIVCWLLNVPVAW